MCRLIQIEKEEAEKVTKAVEAGVYVSPEEPDFDLVDPKDQQELKASSELSAGERAQVTKVSEHKMVSV